MGERYQLFKDRGRLFIFGVNNRQVFAQDSGLACWRHAGGDCCVRALEHAIKELPIHRKPIHHSDQGSQYCCHEYVKRLRERGLEISMTESNHCAENALAERMNGILKQEYGLGSEFRTKADAHRAVKQGIWLYNS